jgi:hypothetical protein
VTVHHKPGHPAHGKPHHTTAHGKPVAWKHEPVHRKGVPYRHASLHQQFGQPGMRGGDGWRNQRGPGSAPKAQHGDGGHAAGNRDGRSDGHRDSVGDRGGREVTSQRPSTQGGTNVAPGKPNFDSGSRGSGTASPSAPGYGRRSDAGRDGSRFQERGGAPAPTTRQAQRPDSHGNNNVLRFPTPQAGPSAPASRQERADSNGNNVHRFQGHVPAPRSAPAAPVVRQDPRPAVPQRSAQPGTVRPQQFRPPQAVSHGGSAPRPVAMPQQRMAPPPQAQARGNAAPRMANGNGNFHGGGGGGNRGGGSFR